MFRVKELKVISFHPLWQTRVKHKDSRVKSGDEMETKTPGLLSPGGQSRAAAPFACAAGAWDAARFAKIPPPDAALGGGLGRSATNATQKITESFCCGGMPSLADGTSSSERMRLPAGSTKVTV